MNAEKPAAATTPAPASTSTRIDADRFKFGVLIRAKFIGVEDVKQDTGDDICQTSMVKLKAVVLAKKEHKPRICIRINLEGVEILDEKTNDSLYKHSVNRISYIARDVNDARAIGYIYKTPTNEYQYFAIKTIGQAQELFNALKDLFEVVLEMRTKKKADSISQAAGESAPETQEPAPKPATDDSKLASQLSTDTADLEQKIKQMNDQQNLLDMAPAAAKADEPPAKEANIFDDLEQINISTPAVTEQAKTQEMKNELLDIFSSGPATNTPPSNNAFGNQFGGSNFSQQSSSPFGNVGMGSSPPMNNTSPFGSMSSSPMGQAPRLPPMPPQMGQQMPPQLPPMPGAFPSMQQQPGHFMGVQPAFAGFPAPGQPNYNVNISNPFGSMQQPPAQQPMFNQFQQQQAPPKPNISANFPFN